MTNMAGGNGLMKDKWMVLSITQHIWQGLEEAMVEEVNHVGVQLSPKPNWPPGDQVQEPQISLQLLGIEDNFSSDIGVGNIGYDFDLNLEVDPLHAHHM